VNLDLLLRGFVAVVRYEDILKTTIMVMREQTVKPDKNDSR